MANKALVRHKPNTDVGFIELDPLKQYITYEDSQMIVFEFPHNVNVDMWGGIPSALKFFKDVTYSTRFTGVIFVPCKITALKRMPFMLGRIIPESEKLFKAELLKLSDGK